jgi:glycosyltransferase involved in cell wall biosynthesis
LLTKRQLKELYDSCDFGMVASLSNISLVPYEMLSSGLPLIEFEDGTFQYFFKGDCAILVSLSGKSLYDGIRQSMRQPQMIISRMQNARGNMSGLSWEHSAGQLRDIIEHIL